MPLFKKIIIDINLGLLIPRVLLGLSYIFFHGLRKVTSGPEGWEKLGRNAAYVGLDFFPMFWGIVATAAEFLGGIFLVFGLFTRISSFFIIITMIVAFTQTIAKGETFLKSVYPLEMAFFVLVYFLIGAGNYSLDYLIFNKEKKKDF